MIDFIIKNFNIISEYGEYATVYRFGNLDSLWIFKNKTIQLFTPIIISDLEDIKKYYKKEHNISIP